MLKETVRNSHATWKATNISNLLLFLAVIVFIVGFSCPFWSGFESPYFSRYAGLWRCPSDSSCTLNTIGQPTAAQCIECIALFLYILACAAVIVFYYCLYQDRYSAYSSVVSKTAGILSIIGGLFGIIGCIVYSVYVHNSSQDDLAWAFILTITASIIITLVGGGLVVLSTPALRNFCLRKYEVIVDVR